MIFLKLSVVDGGSVLWHLVPEEACEEDPVQGVQAGSWEEQQEELKNNDGKQKR